MTKVQFIHYYRNNLSALENFAKKLTKNQVEAEELVQETAIKAFRGMHTFKPGNSFKSWAFTILKNTFITKYNRKRKRGIVNIQVEDMSYAIQNSRAISNDAVSKLRVNEIKGCIKKLSVKSRKPFEMHIQGFQYNEIATSLNIPIGTVKSRINFARTKLRSILHNEGIINAA